MKMINNDVIDALFDAAHDSKRLRAHLNLHTSYEEKVQRVLIALVKGIFVEPHYHELDTQWEMFTVLRGTLEVKLYSEIGEIKSSILVGEQQSTGIIQFEPNQIHSVECISDEALLLEVKEGPFLPERAKCFPEF